MNTQKEIAYAWRGGDIEFSALPESEHGGIAICPELAGHTNYRETIETWARLAYDNKTLLVPGVPEAKDDEDAALNALRRFNALIYANIIGEEEAAEPETK